MNIFYLNENPKACAELHVDKHVVKMCLEYAQILSTVHHVLDGKNVHNILKSKIYKPTHKNHPCVKWAAKSSANYQWLYELYVELGKEYTYRYDREHKSLTLKSYLKRLPKNIEIGEFTEPPKCMPDHCKVDESVTESYQKYYLIEKTKLLSWKRRTVPYFVESE